VGGSFSVADKVYDGNVAATVLDNLLVMETPVSGDDPTLKPVAAFVDKNVATSKSVSLTEESLLVGETAFNYSLSLVGAPPASADILSAELTVTGAMVDDKVYDGSAEAAISGGVLMDVIDGDVVSLSEPQMGTFAQATVGIGIAVTPGFELVGEDANNYELRQPADLMADINVRSLTLPDLIVADKVYDGTTRAEIEVFGVLAGVVNSDDVSLDSAAAVAHFDSFGVGVGKTVTVSGLALVGPSAHNYSIPLQTTTADIFHGATSTHHTPTSWYEGFGMVPTDFNLTTWEELDEHDPDGDNMLNWMEYVAGTDPTDPTSVFRIVRVTTLADQNTHIEWLGGTTGPEEPYIIQRTLSLANPDWETVSEIHREEGINRWTSNDLSGSSSSSAFYRILALPESPDVQP
jgi:hypothetical protein